MRDIVVFRTTDPAVTSAFDQSIEAYNDWGRRIREFAREVHPDANPMVSDAWGERSFGGISMVDPIPDGWRVVNPKQGSRHLVPRRSVKAGKAWAARLDDLRSAPSVRGALPGMPTNVFSGLHVLNPGIEKRGGALYVTWSEDPRRDGSDTGFSKVRTVDDAIWEQVKLSEYYALKEAQTETASDEGAA